MSRISVRGFAVASATAVTSVGAVVGVAAGADSTADTGDRVEATAADQTLLADIPAQSDVRSQYAMLTEQADVAADTASAEARTALQESARKQAAADAQAKKEAAEQAAKEREAAEQAASRSAVTDSSSIAVQSSYTVAEVQAIARQMIPADQFQCFSNIVDHESGWNYQATNPSSGAYGLMQALPGSKMVSAGADWQTNPATQIEWGLNYMNSRYDSPCGAWNFWQANNWY